jgi:subtilisin family serine protease
MKIAPLFLGMVACQSASTPDAPVSVCSVSVRFGSYAMGIDQPAAARIEALLAGSRDVTNVARTGSGREGEFTLCVTTRTPAGAARLVEAIAALLPEQPRGPISVAGAGRRIDAPAR